MSTYRTTFGGQKINSDGLVLDTEFEPTPIRSEDVTITGTQLQNMNTTPITVVPAVLGRNIIPIAWHASLTHAGGTNFSVNDDLEIASATVGASLGEATGAIAGGSSIVTTGTILSGESGTSEALVVRVKTGNPTGGHATASLEVRVLYIVV